MLVWKTCKGCGYRRDFEERAYRSERSRRLYAPKFCRFCNRLRKNATKTKLAYLPRLRKGYLVFDKMAAEEFPDWLAELRPWVKGFTLTYRDKWIIPDGEAARR